MKGNQSFWVIIAIQLAMVALVGLAVAGLNIPGLRQLIGVIYLTLIPGALILRILRVNKTGLIEKLCYSVGLSLAFAMFMGFFVNLLYPIFGIERPISALPLIVTFAATIGVLCVVAYIRKIPETMAQGSASKLWSEMVAPQVLFLLLLPLLSILGSYYLANFYHNNILLLVLLALIAVVAVLVTFNRFIRQRHYPLAIAMIAISLLWHQTLISQYISGFDIHHEYYWQNLVVINGFWDSTPAATINGMLSVVLLGPIYSLFLNMDAVWVLKIVYPLLFSLVPLALFQVFRKQTDDKVGFFAAFLLMSTNFFFFAMVQLARMQIGELFFVMFISLLLDRTMVAGQKMVLLIVFGCSIVVSHYGLSYFFIFYLVLAFGLLSIMGNRTLMGLWKRLGNRLSRAGNAVGMTRQELDPPETALSSSSLTATLVYLIIVFGLSWYIYIGSRASFNSVINIGTYLYDNIKDFFLLETRGEGVLLAIGLASPTVISAHVTSVQREIFLVIQYAVQFFIVVGVAGFLFNLIKARFQPVYFAMTIVSSLVLFLSIVLPYFAGYFSMDRIFHITLLFLAPFCVLGGMAAFRWLFRVVPAKFFRNSANGSYLNLVVILVLVPYFLFNTAFIYAVTGDNVTSIALNPDMDYPRYNNQEVSGKQWLASKKNPETLVYADFYGITFLAGPVWDRAFIFVGDGDSIADDSYVYLRSLNVKQGMVLKSRQGSPRYVDLQSSSFGEKVLASRSRIYSNGDSEVYR